MPGLDVAQGGVMPFVFDGGGGGGGGGRRDNAFEAVLQALAGTDRSDIRGAVRSTGESIMTKLDGNETRRHAHELASLDNQEEIKHCIENAKCHIQDAIAGLKNSMLERELDDVKQRNMILEMAALKPKA